VGSLRYALENVTVMCWALGTAAGTAEELAALHGPRLEMMLWAAIDSSSRGVLYEAAGPADPAALAAGAEVVARFGESTAIPYALVHADPLQPSLWVPETRAAIEALLGHAGNPYGGVRVH
jgi:hypothetical protein